MTSQERLDAIAGFGFSRREAAFLATVALHGGYCLHRQYCTAAGVIRGQHVRAFFARLVAKKLATMTRFANRTSVYHLYASTLYDAIDEPDNRNRRTVDPPAIARKLMVLDYVIAHPNYEYCATEREKVALFTQAYGVPLEQLPGRTYYPVGTRATVPTRRYFIEKWPVFRVPHTTAVHVVFLAADQTAASFRRFLDRYAALIDRVPAVVVVGLAPAHDVLLRRCASLFAERWPPSRQATLAPRVLADLRRYFEARAAFESGRRGRLDQAALDHLSDGRHRFTGPRFDRWYERWRQDGDRAFEASDADTSDPLGTKRFQSHVLRQEYRCFGAFPGLA